MVQRGPSRISQVQQQLQSVIARLDSGKTSLRTPETERLSPLDAEFGSQQEPVEATHSPTPVEATSTDEGLPALDGHESAHEFTTEDGRPAEINPRGTFNSRAHPELGLDESHELLNDLISGPRADVLLEQYRNMSKTFPFVPVPRLTAKELYAKKPMLLLAMLTASSWKQHKDQMSLERIYRRELANRIIMKPRKNISLVQSLLVYLAWYHLYFSHKHQNILIVLHMLVGLVLDLGLNQSSKQPIILRRPYVAPGPAVEREEQRTLLGTYYLASTVSSLLHKPKPLATTPYLFECARRLKEDREFETDLVLESLLRIRRAQDLSPDSLQLHAAMDPSIGSYNTDLDVGGRITQIVLGLSHNYSIIEFCDATNKRSLEAAKSFLDLLVSWPVNEYHLLSFVEWMRLPPVVISICRLSFATDEHQLGWNVNEAQVFLRLDLYLDSLCYRMQSLTTFHPPKQSHPDFWFAMRVIMDKIRDWYLCRTRTQSQCTATTSEERLPPDSTPTTTLDDILQADISTQEDDQFAAAASLANFDFDFNPDSFLNMDFWGGPESYDPTICHDDTFSS